MNLGQVKEEELMKTVLQMQEVNLAECQLQVKQVETILDAIIEQKEVRLSSIDMSGNVLSEVNDKKLAKCIRKLEKVELRFCRLTNKQVECICKEILEEEAESKTKMINVEGNWRKISPIDLAKYKKLINQLKKNITVEGLGLGHETRDDGGWAPAPILRMMPPRPYYKF